MTTISKSLLNGLPIKKSRIQVFEILNQNPHGLSADSIYAQIKNEYKITLGTIYRILSEFENRKLVKRVFLGKSKSIYKLRKDKMSCNLISLKTAETSSFEHEKVNELLYEVMDIIFANTGTDISSVELNLYTE
ncbi:transcriptional repressor [Acinetobacter nosocomialis]|uniref:Fur family transcriptional regulator n=2 Tax=Acinetobacter nosocomialis TaxID=106654 RepID=A0AB36M4B6_ACINO|nr:MULTISPECIES: transcriptional repressor [Acinetobacter]KCY47644.1 ferric uptake regulator family protein [Acinetobacter baumannii 1571545]KCZ29134.1 ferric uptake regulator family protein [Acinetobacter baumannii 25977_9]SSQ34746.1 ferric uptake regulation protein [Acinetobacter baumannii]EXB69319.1 ferric uptake regulator family protein [Acinetobacter sp. 21871]EXR65071.1 ferric uptake regulator family protein [Acinetobacter sp. 1424608]